jgi:hypothetical protein
MKLTGGEHAAKFLEEVGIADSPALVDAFNQILRYDEPMNADDLAALVDTPRRRDGRRAHHLIVGLRSSCRAGGERFNVAGSRA